MKKIQRFFTFIGKVGLIRPMRIKQFHFYYFSAFLALEIDALLKRSLCLLKMLATDLNQ